MGLLRMPFLRNFSCAYFRKQTIFNWAYFGARQVPIGLRFFRLTPEVAAASAQLAANQGLYNGFITAGIVAGLMVSDPGAGFALIAFSLSCVIAAGVFAAFTVSWRTLVVQAAPGAVALAALIFLG